MRAFQYQWNKKDASNYAVAWPTDDWMNVNHCHACLLIRVNWAIDKSNTVIGFTLSAIFAVVLLVILHVRRNSVEYPAFRNITPVYRVTVLRIMYPFVAVMDIRIHLNAFRNVLVFKWLILSIDRVAIIIHAEMQSARTTQNVSKIDKFACQ